MDYLSTQQTADRWGVSLRYVQRLLHDGRIPGAQKFSGAWFVPETAHKPLDPRVAQNVPDIAPAEPCRLPRQCPLLAFTTLYGKPGTADAVLAGLEEQDDAHALFAMQLAYLRGENAKTAKLARALLAKSDEFCVQLGCYSNLANNSLYSGDYTTWHEARNAIAQLPCANQSETNMRDLCLAGVDGSVYDSRSYPQWLSQGDFTPLPLNAFPTARYLFAKRFLLIRADLTVMPALEPLCSQTRVEGAVGAELYLQLMLATGYHNATNAQQAKVHIQRALELALPDKLYAPLAESRKNMGQIFDNLLREQDAVAYRKVCTMSDELFTGWTVIVRKQLKRVIAHDLTLRESEAARFASLGKSNEQIAKAMGVSVNTVRGYMSSVLQKTGLTSRAELDAYLTCV